MAENYHSEAVLVILLLVNYEEMMWRMLIKKSKGNLKITFQDVLSDGKKWER